MSLYYLARQHTLREDNAFPCAQLVNVPELQGTQRCPYCVHFTQGRTREDYWACQEKQRCGSESLLYATLHNSFLRNRRPNSNHFSPTPLIRQTVIDSVKRYLQLWSCDIPGYVCNSRCQFYATRLAKEESVATCSNSHGCGANGSFLDLLQIWELGLFTLPDIFRYSLPANRFYLDDGTLLTASLVYCLFNEAHVLVAKFDDGSEYEILNMIYTSSCAGYECIQEDDLFSCAQFNFRAWPEHVAPGTCVLMRRSDGPIAQMLLSLGMLDKALYEPLGVVAEVPTTDTSTTFLMQNVSRSLDYTASGVRLFTLFDYRNKWRYVFKLGNTDYYVGLRPGSDEPKTCYRVKFTGTIPTGITVYTISTYGNQVATLLRALGVRASVFYNL